MSDAPRPVYARADDGAVVQVGTAYPLEDGFEIQLGALTAGKPTRAAAPATGADGLPTTLPPYGKAKGMPIAGASQGDLEYYIKGCRRTLDDPGKARFHAKERLMLQALEAELARQNVGGERPSDPNQRAESDDLPF